MYNLYHSSWELTAPHYLTTNVMLLSFVKIELKNVYEDLYILDMIVIQVRHKIDPASGDTI